MKLEQKVRKRARLLRWQWWAKAIGIGFGTGIVLFLFLVLYLRSQPLPESRINETTTVYGEGNQVIAALYKGENRDSIALEQVPLYLRQATIAVEDRKFYEHPGFDVTRLVGAGLTDLTHMAKLQGGSTITMQLARNLYLNLDKTWSRKVKEALLTLQLELNYSKDQLLELYLNQIYYGHSAYGIEAAAQTYFNKKASELNLAESSLLVGLPKGPKYYSPFLNFNRSKERQYLVLQAMVEEGYISRTQAEAAFKEPLQLATKKASTQKMMAPYFIDYVTHLVKEKYQIDEHTFQHGGLKIYTTLDPAIQKAAEEAVQKNLPQDAPLQAALISIDPKTGFIKALVGGRDYKESQYNRVFAKRPPGSSIKPMLYMAALENGFTPLTLVKDEPTTFTYEDGKDYNPKNFKNRYTNNFINMRNAIKQSNNIYAVTAHMQIGNEKMIDMAKRLGIGSNLSLLPSQALGPDPVSPYDMTVAYGTIANQGKRMEPLAIKKIVDKEGNVLVENEARGTQVADGDNAFVLSYLMQSVFEQGGTAASIHHLLNRPIAGKTGSTDYDSWLCGFTPQLATTVWIGYDDNRKIEDKYTRKGQPIWGEFMANALKNQPKVNFEVTPGVVAAYIDPTSNQLATEQCPTKELMYFKLGTEPTESCELHPSLKKEQEKKKKNGTIWERFKGWFK
ncbi:MAG TPA: carboxypeptidase [Paenibacillaceae bacterium]|nr:carboxypeptidase [Paenibacillaceae bacterium]